MQERHTVVTGVGVVCAAGCGLDEVSASLGAGLSGLGPLTLFQSPRFGHALVGQVRADVDRLAGRLRGSRSDKLAWIAAKEALDQSQARLKVGSFFDPNRVGVVMGGTVGGMTTSEVFVRRLLLDRRFLGGLLKFHECACSTMLVAQAVGAKGPCITLSTACSAAGMAIAAGAELIAGGDADMVLAGGSDSLSRLTLNGFGSLLLVDPKGCRPFDVHRAGIALGEGAAVLVLELEDAARVRGAPILARLTGWGSSCDAFHATAPQPDGVGAAAAMRCALKRAGLEPSAISYVSAHGTGTKDNDLMEARALKVVFDGKPPPFSSTKRFFGHTLAASGAVKAAVCIDALMNQRMPPSLGFEEMDPEIGLEPVRMMRPGVVDHVMSNSFGFGGSNVSLVFSRFAPVLEGRASSRPSLTGVVQEIREKGPCLAVVGAGVVSPAGIGPDAFFDACRRNIAAIGIREMPAGLPAGKVPAFVCGEFGAESVIAAGRRRRLARLQQMTLVAARQSVPLDLQGKHGGGRGCVAVGTGLGMLNEASSFVENMITNDEQSPMPLCFTNSVHNALASQVAIELGIKGMNSTPTHREVSFEIALWQGGCEIRNGNSDMAVIGAADELNHFALAAGMRWGWWDAESRVHAPFSAGYAGCRRPLTGEGAAMFSLARPELTENALAYVWGAQLGMCSTREDGGLDARAEAILIRKSIEQGGRSLDDIEMLLTGANGWMPMDERYRAVVDALSEEAGRQIPCGAYKQWCGEFYSASALGFLAAIGMVRGELGVRHLVGPDQSVPDRAHSEPVVVLYTLSAGGARGLSCIGNEPNSRR